MLKATAQSWRPWSASSWIGRLAILCAAVLPAVWAKTAHGCEDPAIAEEAIVEEGVVVDSEPTVTDEGETTVVETGSSTEWSARPIRQREVGAVPAYVRQSSDAFENPDARQSLELKYYFEVPDAMAMATSLDRRQGDPALGRIELDGPAALGDLADRFPLDFGRAAEATEANAEAQNAGAEAQWLDYVSGDRAKLVAVLLPATAGKEKEIAADAGDPANDAWLLVLRVKLAGDHWVVDKKLAARAIDAQELPPPSPGRMRLDTWDRPMGLGSKSVFLGRLIGVLKVVDGRYAVDFYGEALHPDSDCRVWLAPPEHSLGTPRGIRFSELPVRKADDRVATAWVLLVDYETSAGARSTIALDYPICRPAIMAQMSKINNPRKPGPDLQKLLGDDLLDEFTRRIVDGTYK
jgi:hypothetical protein